MKLYSWNINGLRAIHRKGFTEWLLKTQPDVVGLQEIKSKPDQLPFDLQFIEGYTAHYNSAQRPGYSGVALYTKNKDAKVWSGMGIEKFDNEGRIINIDLGGYIFSNVYFPNGKQSAERLAYKMEFYKTYQDWISKQSKPVIVCGDVNTAHKPIDLSNPKSNEKISGFLPEERAWIDGFLAMGYIDAFRVFNQQAEQYTWWSAISKARDRNVGWRIDFFFVPQVLAHRLKNCWHETQVMGSDHCPIAIEID